MDERRCEVHLESFTSETGECPLCIALGRGEPEPGPVPGAEEGDEAEAYSKPDASGLQQDEDLDDAAAATGNEEREDHAPDVIPLGNRADGGADEAHVIPPEKSRTADDRFFEDLARIKKEEKFAILFFGFRTAGKTWLLQRIKQELFSEGINCVPPLRLPDSHDVLDLGASSGVEFHYVLGNPAYVLIDINGEAAEDLIEGKLDDLRQLLAAMDYAQAMIVALPSDVIFFGELFPSDATDLSHAIAQTGGDAPGAEIEKIVAGLGTLNTRLQHFSHGLFLAVGILSYLRQRKIDPADKRKFDALNMGDVISHMTASTNRMPIGGQDGLDCPTFIALTKADLALSALAELDIPKIESLNKDIGARLDGRVYKFLAERGRVNARLSEGKRLGKPAEVLRILRRDLYAQLAAAFPLAKVDYVTAFYGHPGGTLLTKNHYERHPQLGVLEMIEWIAEAYRIGGKRPAARLPYFLASRMERYLMGIKPPRQVTFQPRKRR